MIFNWGVFSLVAIFCWAGVAYEIERCNEPDLTWVSNAVTDALYLVTRAVQSLQEVMDSDAPREESLVIVDGFLGTLKIIDITDKKPFYQAALGKS